MTKLSKNFSGTCEGRSLRYKLTDTRPEVKVKVKYFLVQKEQLGGGVCVQDMNSLQFNAVLLEISNQLSTEQLENMKFLCRHVIGKKDTEKIRAGVTLFQFLTERGRLGEDNTEYLSELLKKIQRLDLSEKLNSFESQPGYTDNQADETEKGSV